MTKTKNKSKIKRAKKAVAKSEKGFKKSLFVLPDFDLKKLLDHIQGLVDKAPNGIVQLFIDLFCGAGGTSEGMEQAEAPNGAKCSTIIAGINHDEKALFSQFTNHPHPYYSTEDIRHAKLEKIKKLMDICRKRWPQCPIYIWASLECTNHSNAKGGGSRDADSRSLAWHMFRYLRILQPDGLWIENVKEFFEWGPTYRKVVMYKGNKKYVHPEEVPRHKESEYYAQKIAEGWIISSPLEKPKKPKRKSDPILSPRPIWIPVKRLKGIYYQAWKNKVMQLGYDNLQEWFLNAADFGVPQNRNRFFPIFMRTGQPITRPEPTHAKNVMSNDLFNTLQPHRPIKECLDFSIEGESIFTPKKIKSEESFKRYLAGCIKFIAGGHDAYMAKVYSGNPLHKVYSIDSPSSSITCTGGNNQFIKFEKAEYFITKFIGNNEKTGFNNGKSINDPSITIPCTGVQGLVKAEMFMDVIYGNGTPRDINWSSASLRTKDGQALLKTEDFSMSDIEYFLINMYGQGGGQTGSINSPAPATLSNPKTYVANAEPFISTGSFGHIGHSINLPSHTILSSRHHHYIINPSHGGYYGSIDNPSHTIIASQHKAPLMLVNLELGWFGIGVLKTDSPTVVKLKEFMAAYLYKDITMRMLTVPELLAIQSFPKNYYLAGGSTEQKKFIGNAVPPLLARRISESMYIGTSKHIMQNRIL